MAPEIRRLHPLSWLFITASSVRALILPLVLVVFASSSNSWTRYQWLSLLVVFPVLVAALLKQGIYNYRFDDDELVIREGILTRKERHIPYDRVHNVALIRNPFHRMFGVASAKVETATGGQAEALMQVLSLEAVDELREFTLGKRPAGATPALATGAAGSTGAAGAIAGAGSTAAAGATAPAGSIDAAGATAAPGSADATVAAAATDATAAGAIEPEATAVAGATGAPAPAQGRLLQLPTRELVRLGLISNKGFVVVAAVFGLLSQTDWWDRDWQAYYEWGMANAPQLNRQAPELLRPDSWTARIFLGIASVLLFLIMLRVFSVVWYVLKYHDFTLARDDADLRTEYGMLTKVSSLIPADRIQLMSAKASLLHRWAGRTGIDMEIAGGASGGGDDFNAMMSQNSRHWVAPIIAADRAVGLIHEITPEIDLGAIDWQPIAPRAASRILKKSLFAVALLTSALMMALSFAPIPGGGWQGLWFPAVAVPLIYFAVVGWVRHAAWALTDHAVLFRSGWLAKKISMVRYNKVQTVQMSESPFDRRYRMASVQVDTAGAGSADHRIDIPYLAIDVAGSVKQRLYEEAAVSEYSW